MSRLVAVLALFLLAGCGLGGEPPGGFQIQIAPPFGDDRDQGPRDDIGPPPERESDIRRREGIVR
jgi:hypothetical protein